MHKTTAEFLQKLNEPFLFSSFNFLLKKNLRQFLSHNSIVKAQKVLSQGAMLNTQKEIRAEEFHKIQAVVDAAGYIINCAQQLQKNTKAFVHDSKMLEKHRAALGHLLNDVAFAPFADRFLEVINNVSNLSSALNTRKLTLPFFNSEELVMASLFSLIVVAPLSALMMFHISEMESPLLNKTAKLSPQEFVESLELVEPAKAFASQ